MTATLTHPAPELKALPAIPETVLEQAQTPAVTRTVTRGGKLAVSVSLLGLTSFVAWAAYCLLGSGMVVFHALADVAEHQSAGTLLAANSAAVFGPLIVLGLGVVSARVGLARLSGGWRTLARWSMLAQASGLVAYGLTFLAQI